MAVVFVGVRSGAEASVINSLYNWWASVTGLGTV
jgi:hypothetical protein